MKNQKDVSKVRVNNEDVYLFKSRLFGWSVVNPINNEDGSWNWKNLILGGSWFRFWVTLGLVAVLIGAIFEYSDALRIANECLAQTKSLVVKW